MMLYDVITVQDGVERVLMSGVSYGIGEACVEEARRRGVPRRWYGLRLGLLRDRAVRCIAAGTVGNGRTRTYVDEKEVRSAECEVLGRRLRDGLLLGTARSN